MIGSSSIGAFSTSQSILDIRNEIDRLSLQLSTGKVTQSISGLGGKIARSVNIHSRLSRLSTFTESITTSGASLDSVLNVINSFSRAADQIQTNFLAPTTTPNAAGRNSLKSSLRSQFSSLIDYLNTDFNGAYLFGGKAVGEAPTAKAKNILEGSEGKAGLKQYIEERVRANCGTDNSGRLKIDRSGTNITLSETMASQTFGFKIKAITSTDPAIVVTETPASDVSPPGAVSKKISVGDGATASAVVTVTLELPDGTTTDVKLSPTAAPGMTTFALGSSAEQTAQNISTALSGQLKYHSQIELKGAAAQQAAMDFFKGSSTNPPRRVKGDPPESATTFETDPATITASTVIWYTGTDDSNDPRMDQASQLTEHISTGTGARANEPGFIETLANTALMALGDFSATDSDLASAQFADLRDRARTGMNTASEDLNEMKVSVASARASIKSASEDLKAQQTVMESVIADIENASPEKTAMMLSTMQTSLQVMYQVTARLSSLSLANYL